jgi:endonuclease/exonuclease/phosphatase family protein
MADIIENRDFDPNIPFFPNRNIISYKVHNNSDSKPENQNEDDVVISKHLVSNNFVADGSNVKLKMKFTNNTFPEVMNFYENLVLTSAWDVRENADYETLLLARSHLFYNTIKYKWKNNLVFNDFLNKINEKKDNDLETTEIKNKKIESKNNTSNPLRLFSDAFNHSIQEKYIDVAYDFKPEENKNNEEQGIFDNFEKNLFRNGSRKFSENHFAISKINLISHDIKINNTPNSVSIVTGNGEDDEDKIVLSVVNSGVMNDIVEKPISNVLNSIGEEITENNFLIQADYMATQLIKELELTYQGTITILYNKDIQMGDLITLIDETASLQGIFKIMSFEHILDTRGLITILKVCASFEIRDPVINTYSNDISYKLMESFKENVAVGFDESDSYIVNKVFAYYMKYITHSEKYTNFRYVFFENEKGTSEIGDIATERSRLTFTPSIIPIRFYPMLKKGIMQIPDNLEKAFGYQNAYYQEGIFKYFSNFFSIKIKNTLKSFGKTMVKAIVFLADTVAETLSFGLSNLLKPFFGVTQKHSDEGIIGEIDVDKNEFKTTPYSPYGNITSNNLGRKFDFTVAFFNTQLQSTDNLNNNFVIKDKDKAIKNLIFKEKSVKNYITETFDITLMVEIYDGFNKEVNGTKLIPNYTYKDYIKNIEPENNSSNILGPLFTNHHGSEFGVVFSKNKNSTSKLHKSGVVEKVVISKDSNGNLKTELRERNFVETIIDISELNMPISKLHIFWFHNFYGASDYDVDDISIRRKFISNILKVMQQRLNENKGNVATILMGDCNLQLFNFGEKGVKKHIGDSVLNNYYYVLPEAYKKSLYVKLSEATTIDTKGELKNAFDNIVVSKNLIEGEMANYFYTSIYNYPVENKRMVSDHIPVYIGFKR